MIYKIQFGFYIFLDKILAINFQERLLTVLAPPLKVTVLENNDHGEF